MPGMFGILERVLYGVETDDGQSEWTVIGSARKEGDPTKYAILDFNGWRVYAIKLEGVSSATQDFTNKEVILMQDRTRLKYSGINIMEIGSMGVANIYTRVQPGSVTVNLSGVATMYIQYGSFGATRDKNPSFPKSGTATGPACWMR